MAFVVQPRSRAAATYSALASKDSDTNSTEITRAASAAFMPRNAFTDSSPVEATLFPQPPRSGAGGRT